MPKKTSKNGVQAGDNSVVIGGNVSGSNIIVGNNNNVKNTTVNISVLFDDIYRKLEQNKNIAPQEKQDIQSELKEVQQELEKGEPDESFLARRFRNIKRMSPDILDVAIETLKNPISGVVEVVKKVAKKVSEETGTKE